MIKKKNLPNKPLPPRADGTTAPPLRLASVTETCGYARLGRTKLYDYLNRGVIVGYKRGGRTLIDLDSVDAMHASLVPIEPKAAADV
jgi:hypothetical protein